MLLFAAVAACEEKATDEQPGEEVPVSGGITGVGGGGGGTISSRAIAAPPTDVSRLAATRDSITIAWVDRASNELIYEVERCAGIACTDFAPATRSPVAADTTTLTEPGLSPDSLYRFRIRATNRNGSSAFLTSSEFSTLLEPNADLNEDAAETESITISWTPTVSPHTSVEIERCTGADCTEFRPVYNSPFQAPITTHTEPGLSAETTYRFRLRAVSAATTSDWLVSENFSTTSLPVEPAPTGFAVSAVTPTSAVISWVDESDSELFYEIEQCAGSGCSDFQRASGSPVAADSVDYNATDLSPATTYVFRVRASGATSSSEWLTGSEFTTSSTPVPAPNAPDDIAIGATTATSIGISWTDQSSDETGFEIEMCTGASCSNFTAVSGMPLSAGTTTHSVSGLTGGTTYRFRVRAVRSGDASSWETSSDATTTTTAPSSFTLVDLTDTTVAFAWADNSSNELFYEVQRCSGSGCSSFASAAGSPLAANTTSYSGTDLSASTFYTYRVRATSAAGSSDWVVGTELKSAPPAPTALVTGTVSGSAIQISWTDNSTDETSYEVQKCSGASCSSFASVSASPLAASSLTHSETGLSGATIYRFRVRAVRSGVNSAWLTSGNITTLTPAASCASPTTVVIDRGMKGNTTAVGRGLHSDLMLIPGTRQPAIAYYDGSATGGNAQIKISYWNGSTFKVETVAGDLRVAAGSATWVRLAFLSTGVPMVFWTTGATTVKGAMRSAALGTAGTWTAAVIDTVAGAATRALEVAVSPLDQVGLIYLTNTTTAGRARFIYCAANCASIASFTTMSAAGDTIEAANVTAAFMGTGIGWCKHDASTYYPAVVYPGNGGNNIRYSSCQGALSTCQTVAGWSGQTTNVVASAGVTAKLLIDPTIVGDPPKILTRNAGNTLLQAFQMNQACNAAPAYTFTAGNTLGAATSGNAWAEVLKSSAGTFHVIANLGTTNVHYHNSLTTNFATTTWNTAGTVDTITLPAAGAGVGGADINTIDSQIYASYGAAAAPFNINMGVVADTTTASSSAVAVFYTYLPDLSGSIHLPLATGQTRNVSAASTSDGRPGVAYVDFSIGTAAAAQLKYAFRDSEESTVTWEPNIIPNTTTPMAPALAYDEDDKPWITYYDGGTFRYYLLTNSATDGTGEWSSYQFPINAKTATATAPATDETAIAMLYSGGVAKPVMFVLNSTAAGGTGVRAALFDKEISSFTGMATIDALGASYGTGLTADFDLVGNVVVAYYDLTATRVEFNYSTNALTWLGTPPQISAAGAGREGLDITLNRATGKPAVSYYDRANNGVYYTRCTSALSSCNSGSNWVTTTVTSAAGVSGIGTANEKVLSTSLTYDAEGTPHLVYSTGTASALQLMGVATDTSGSFVTTTLTSSASSAVAGAAAPNFAMTGLSPSAVRTTLGTLVATYVGPNNWLYATSCGD